MNYTEKDYKKFYLAAVEFIKNETTEKIREDLQDYMDGKFNAPDDWNED